MSAAEADAVRRREEAEELRRADEAAVREATLGAGRVLLGLLGGLMLAGALVAALVVEPLSRGHWVAIAVGVLGAACVGWVAWLISEEAPR